MKEKDTMSFLEQFREFIRVEKLFDPGDHLILAVSGGVDSVALAEACRLSGFDYSIAHCNFRLRGAESDRDALFTEALAKQFGVPFYMEAFDTREYATREGRSVQEAARELRYGWFAELAEEKSFRIRQAGGSARCFVLTAHHADDNVETLLMNFLKGTGIAGLRGMPPRQELLVRPLLFCRKEALVSFVREQGLAWVEDSSNTEVKYSRNYIRNRLLPIVRELYPKAEDNLIDNLHRFREIEILYRQRIDQIRKKLLHPVGNEIHIPVLLLKKQEALSTLLYEITREYGFTPSQIPELLALLDSGPGKFITSSTHRIIQNRQWLILTPLAKSEAYHILIDKGDQSVAYPGGVLHFRNSEAATYRLKRESATAAMDAALISYPLLLRKWKKGDYFYPFGMQKKKKLSRFFIDQKLSTTEKENAWVLEMDKKIIWVVGQRINDRFKLTPGSREVLEITSR